MIEKKFIKRTGKIFKTLSLPVTKHHQRSIKHQKQQQKKEKYVYFCNNFRVGSKKKIYQCDGFKQSSDFFRLHKSQEKPRSRCEQKTTLEFGFFMLSAGNDALYRKFTGSHNGFIFRSGRLLHTKCVVNVTILMFLSLKSLAQSQKKNQTQNRYIN